LTARNNPERSALRKLSEALAESFQIHRNANSLFRGLENDEGCRLAALERVEKRLFEDHLCVAAILEAAYEISAPNVFAVDVQTKTVWQEYAKRRQYTQNFGLIVCGAQHDD